MRKFVWNDEDIMHPAKFVREHLDDVAEVQLLDKDATSFLVGIVYKDGRRELGIVYPPTDIRPLWDMEVGTPTSNSKARYGYPRQEPRCRLEADTPSPIEQILSKGDNSE